MRFFDVLFPMLCENYNKHSSETELYKFLNQVCSQHLAESGFAESDATLVDFGQYGPLVLPYYSMGAIDSLKLFGLDELILFSFYLVNQNRYAKVADMGANIGLHSILMSKLGWEVSTYEPDPIHIEKIGQNASLNKCENITVHEAAISDVEDTLLFTRLQGNQTGSHLKGMKSDVYGDVDEFSVITVPLNKVMNKYDFIKMDIEGAEARAICATSANDWSSTDVMLEVGTPENAKKIFNHINALGLFSFSQKRGWHRVENLDDMPTSYKEGSLFITSQSFDLWQR